MLQSMNEHHDPTAVWLEWHFQFSPMKIRFYFWNLAIDRRAYIVGPCPLGVFRNFGGAEGLKNKGGGDSNTQSPEIK